LAQVYHLRPLFILDRIYTLLHTGSPGAMFSRCATCLFNNSDSKFRGLFYTVLRLLISLYD
jgi:hypothetical protein